MSLSNVDESKSKFIMALYHFLDFFVLIIICNYTCLHYDCYNVCLSHQAINSMSVGPGSILVIFVPRTLYSGFLLAVNQSVFIIIIIFNWGIVDVQYKF